MREWEEDYERGEKRNPVKSRLVGFVRSHCGLRRDAKAHSMVPMRDGR